MQLDFLKRELTLKLVYYGPALSGKTTNLQALHAAIDAASAGRLMTLETKDDRTLFFDLLPLTFKGKAGVSVRLKVFTVPGQVIHAATRKLVVQAADGVVFVADSQLEETQHNSDSFIDLKENLKANDIDLKRLPLVIQFNKRDLPKVRPEGEIAELASRGQEPVYMAVATRGEGVVETFIGLLDLIWQQLEKEHQLADKLGLDASTLLADVCRCFGSETSVKDMLSARVGRAQHVPDRAGP